MPKSKKSVDSYYDAVADRYHERYERKNLHDLSASYPANYFRLQLLMNSFVSKKIKRVIEVGVGEGTPLSVLKKAGIDVWGFDIAKEMVRKSKETMQKNGSNPDQIFWGDIQDPLTYVHALKEGQFDGLMAMGVMPHVENEEMVLKNMSTLVRPGGSVFIEFRNKLLSLFSFNRFTVDFILDDLLVGVSNEVKDAVKNDLESRLRMDMPPVRGKTKGGDAPGYDAILSKFHNPFEVVDMFKKHGFTNVQIHWYHYHPSMPYLGKDMPEVFRNEAIKLEHETSKWRGYFLCSAFVIEAIKGEQE